MIACLCGTCHQKTLNYYSNQVCIKLMLYVWWSEGYWNVEEKIHLPVISAHIFSYSFHFEVIRSTNYHARSLSE